MRSLNRLMMYAMMIIGSAFLICALTQFCGLASAADGDNDGLDDDQEATLASKYSPFLYYEEEEKFFPVTIDYHLNNSNLNQSLLTEVIIDPEPKPSTIGIYTNRDLNYYLDNRLGSVNDSAIEKDYTSKRGDLGYTIYCHVVKDTYKGDEFIVIQYWMFYAYNEGTMNTHEGDWEMVQVVLDSKLNPVETMYSQHTGGQRTSWDSTSKDGDHIKVYVARGSHANYYRPYQGKLSLASDVVGDNGKVIEPDDYDLIILGETGAANHSADQAWIDFAGRWGEFGEQEDELRGKRGPPGPAYRENGDMWHAPIGWGKGLPEVNSTVFRVNWLFYHFLTIFLLVAALTISIKLLLIYKRHRKTGLGNRIFSILYVDRPDMKSIGNIITIVGILLAVVSLFYPWYSVSVDVDSGEYSTGGMVEIISIDGKDGVQINQLESNSGLIQLFSFPLPFSVILGLVILNIILSSVGIQKTSKLGRKYIMAGIKIMIPIIIILVFVAQLGAVLDSTPVDVPEESEDLITLISDSPTGGDETEQIGDYGTVHVKWGLETGGYLLLAGGILMLIGGILEIMAGDRFFKGGEPPEGEMKKEIMAKIHKIEEKVGLRKEEPDAGDQVIGIPAGGSNDSSSIPPSSGPGSNDTGPPDKPIQDLADIGTDRDKVIRDL